MQLVCIEKLLSDLQVENGNLTLKGKFRYVMQLFGSLFSPLTKEYLKLEIPTISSIK